MPRKGIVSRRVQATDPVYGEALVEKFICSMMWEGKKSTAQRVFYGAMDQVAKKTSDDALKIFKKAIENLKPLVEVKTRRVGGANYQAQVVFLIPGLPEPRDRLIDRQAAGCLRQAQILQVGCARVRGLAEQKHALLWVLQER